MSPTKTSLQRAFELARSGKYGPTDIARQLDREGFDGRQVAGHMLKRQLRQMVLDAREFSAVLRNDRPLTRRPRAPR